jgi:hypothetical protein
MVKTLFISIWLITHPVHVSLLSIDYAPDQEAFNVFLRIYFDDFLRDAGISETDQKRLSFSGNDPFTKDVIGSYIKSKIRIIVNDKQLSAKLGNYELSDNELKMNLLFDSVRKVNTITVKNLIMTSLYNDQANMIIVRINDFEQGVKLTPDEPEQTFKIK